MQNMVAAQRKVSDLLELAATAVRAATMDSITIRHILEYHRQAARRLSIFDAETAMDETTLRAHSFHRAAAEALALVLMYAEQIAKPNEG
jgi:hypothetical protein